MIMAVNLFDELKSALQDFKDFLEPNVTKIAPAVQALAGLIPQVKDLITQLADLLRKLQTEITNLDVSGVQGLAEVSDFTGKAKAVLEAARNLLPNEAGTINDVIGIADVVTGLPSLDQVKTEITTLLGDLIKLVDKLQPTG
jgi:ABC-type transporter Mla subunit MlaD